MRWTQIGFLSVALVAAGIGLLTLVEARAHAGATLPDPPNPPSSIVAAAIELGKGAPQPNRVELDGNLTRLFSLQDLDQSGSIDITEAANFYRWVEANIQYRWDDENATHDTQGFRVGDGRPGRDYTQTPLETITEAFGDCEDQNGLQLAFYAHWKIPAYLAFVNAVANTSYDHAVTIVFGAQDRTAFRALLGEAPFYEARNRPGIPDGFYFIVDNTYSNVFAQVSGGIGEDKFVIHHVSTFESLYGGKWALGDADP